MMTWELAISLIALVLSLWNLHLRKEEAKVATATSAELKNIEIDDLLTQAWILMGGDIHTGSIDQNVNSRKDLNQAKVILDKCERLDNESVKSLRYKAIYFSLTNRPELGFKAIDRALSISANDAKCYSTKAMLCEMTGKIDEFVELSRISIDYDPENSWSYIDLASYLASNSREDEASALLLSALKHNPSFPAALNNLGNIYRRNENFKEAGRLYRKAINIDDQDYVAWNNLGLAIEAQGHSAKAVKAFESSLAIFPDYEVAKQNIGRVRGSD